MKKILIILILLSLIIIPVFGLENYQGTIGFEGTNASTASGTFGGGTYSSPAQVASFYVTNIEYTGNLKSVLFQTPNACNLNVDAGAPSGWTTPATFRLFTGTADADGLPNQKDGQIIGTGALGYQRIYNTADPPVCISSYVYATFTTWNASGLSGSKTFWADVGDRANIYHLNTTNTQTAGGICGSGTNGEVVPIKRGSTALENWCSNGFQWYRSNIKDISALADYFTLAPEGLGIQGQIDKTVGASQGFVYNGITGSILASDTTLTTNRLNFTVTYQPLIIGIKSSVGTKYNSSIIFSNATYPTVTYTQPIPTGVPYTTQPTGAPTTYVNLTSKFYDDVTLAQVGSVYVSICKNNGASCLYGTTNSVGEIEFDMLGKGTYIITAYKAGYQNYEQERTLSFAQEITSHYLTPTTTGGIPATINITLTIRNANGGALVPGAYVSLKDDIAGTAPTAAITNANGQVIFHGIPNTAQIGGLIIKSGFYDYSWWLGTGELQQSDYSGTRYIPPIGGIPGTPTATPTITPPPYDNVILSVSPTSINLSDSATLTTTSSTSLWNKAYLVFYYVMPPSEGERLIAAFKKNATTAYFDKALSTGGPWIPGSYDGKTLSVTPTVSGNHQYRVYVSNLTTGNVQTGIGNAKTNLMVGGAGQYGSLTMTLYAMNGVTSSHLNNYNLNITDVSTGIVEDLGSIVYDTKKSLFRGNSYILQGSKTGLLDGSFTFTVPTDENCIEGAWCSYAGVPLYPPGSISTGNTTLTVKTYDAETYLPLPGVEIQESHAPDWAAVSKYIGSSGEGVSFIVPYNTDYAVVGIKDGYCSSSETGNTGTDPYKYVDLMIKYGSCAGTPTPTPTPTSSGTPTPTLTPIGGWGNINYTATQCTHLPDDASWVDLILNTLACNGFKDAQSQGIGLSLLIIIMGALILGKVGGGIGILAGAIVGALLSIMMGFLPLWIIIVLIIIAGLIFAIRLWGAGGGGA